MTERDETMARVYRDAQAACGLKIGDWVKVLRKSETGEGGWPGEWDCGSAPQEDSVGEVGQITDIYPHGIEVRFKCWPGVLPYFPYFILEKVAKPAPVFNPFDRVLVTHKGRGDAWMPNIFSHINEAYLAKYLTIDGRNWTECIPYEGNEHLCGTTGSPEE